MNVLGLYKGSDLPLFKEFSLELDYKGVTVIRGHNQNAKSMQNRNNGSGKSLLLSGIAEIMISSSPAIDRNELYARKSLFPNKTSQITLEVDKRLITKGRFGGAAVSYGIESDTGGLEKVKKDVAYQYLAENLGYNEDSFYTLVYLDGGRDFTLIVGTAVQRIQFLSNLFKSVEVFDQLYSHFSGKMSDFNRKASELEVLEGELSEIQADSNGDSDNVPTKQEVEQLADKLDSLKFEAKNIRKELSNGEMANTWLDLMYKLESSAKTLGINVKDTEDRYKREVRGRQAAKNLAGYEKKRKIAVKNLKDAENELNELIDADTNDSDYDRIKGNSNKSAEYKEKAEQIKAALDDAAKALSLPFRIAEPVSYKSCEELITIIEFMMICLCPSKDLIAKQTEKSPFKLGKSLPVSKNTELLKGVTEAKRNVQIFLKNKVVISDLGKPLTEKEIKRLQRARKNRLKVEELTELVEIERKQVDSLTSSIESLTKPKDLLSDEQFEILEAMYKDHVRLEGIGIDSNNVNSFTPDALKKLRKKQERIEAEISEVSTQYSQAKTSYTFHQENKRHVDRLTTRIGKLEKYRDAVPIVDGLKKAFSNKGIRVMLLDQLTSILSKRMNESAHLVFPEPIEFHFEITERTCEIIAVRNPNTDHAIASDIRTLSRGERKSFSLLLMYSLLPLMPSSQRVNVALLDEMTSNMDAPTKQKVFRDFIPALREIVPHTIIADTGNLEIDDAREYTVVKRGNVSKLVKDVDS